MNNSQGNMNVPHLTLAFMLGFSSLFPMTGFAESNAKPYPIIGIKLNDQVQSLDLVRRGSANIKLETTSSESVIAYRSLASSPIAKLFTSLASQEEQLTLTQKLASLDVTIRRAEIYAPFESWYKAYESYEQIASKQCPELNDPENRPYPNQTTLAFIQGNKVTYCPTFFQLNPEHQLAVMIHAIVKVNLNSSAPVPEFIGAVFHPNLVHLNEANILETRRLAIQIQKANKFVISDFLVHKTQRTTSEIYSKYSSGQYTICFGEGYTSDQHGYGIWSNSKDETCESSRIIKGHNLIFLVKSKRQPIAHKTVLETSFGVPVALIDNQTEKLFNICDKITLNAGQTPCIARTIEGKIKVILQPWIFRRIAQTILSSNGISESQELHQILESNKTIQSKSDTLLTTGIYNIRKDSGSWYPDGLAIYVAEHKYLGNSQVSEIVIVKDIYHQSLLLADIFSCSDQGQCASVADEKNYSLFVKSRNQYSILTTTGKVRDILLQDSNQCACTNSGESFVAPFGYFCADYKNQLPQVCQN